MQMGEFQCVWNVYAFAISRHNRNRVVYFTCDKGWPIMESSLCERQLLQLKKNGMANKICLNRHHVCCILDIFVYLQDLACIEKYLSIFCFYRNSKLTLIIYSQSLMTKKEKENDDLLCSPSCYMDVSHKIANQISTWPSTFYWQIQGWICCTHIFGQHLSARSFERQIGTAHQHDVLCDAIETIRPDRPDDKCCAQSRRTRSERND